MLASLAMVAALTAGSWAAYGLDTRPSLVYSVPDGSDRSSPVLILTCNGTSTDVHVRAFEPRQVWPQPDVEIRLGDASRAGRPDVLTIGERAAFEISFAISDDVLDAVRDQRSIQMTFDGERRDFPAAPQSLAADFARKCGALVHPGMRAAASKHTY